MLRWQFEAGIDEALLDSPDTLASPVKLNELLSQINATANFPAKMLGPYYQFKLGKGIKRGLRKWASNKLSGGSAPIVHHTTIFLILPAWLICGLS